MRYLGLVPLIILASCGGGASQNKAAAAAATLQAGQYEVTAEVTQFTKADGGPPRINTPVGTRTVRSICLADPASPPADLFADQGFTCRIGDGAMIHNGMINLSVSCTRPGFVGDLIYAVNGTFGNGSFQADRQLNTALTGEGDVRIASRLSGRRTGECSAPAAAGSRQGAAPATK